MRCVLMQSEHITSLPPCHRHDLRLNAALPFPLSQHPQLVMGTSTWVAKPSSQLGGMVMQVLTAGLPSAPSMSNISMSVDTQASAVRGSNTPVATSRRCSKARFGRDAAAALAAAVAALNALLSVRRNPTPVSTTLCASCCRYHCCRQLYHLCC